MTVDFTKTRDDMEIIQVILKDKFGSLNHDLAVGTVIALEILSKGGLLPKRLIQRIFISIGIQKLNFDFAKVIETVETKDHTENDREEAVLRFVSNAFLCVSNATKYAQTTNQIPVMDGDEIIDIGDLVMIYLTAMVKDYDLYLEQLQNHAKTEYGASYDEVRDILEMLASTFKQTPQ
jgi:hypothetical protein